MNLEKKQKYYKEHIVNEAGEEKVMDTPNGGKAAFTPIGDGWKEGNIFNTLRCTVIKDDGTREEPKYWVVGNTNYNRLAVCDEAIHATLICSALNLASERAMKAAECKADALIASFSSEREVHIAADIVCNMTNDVKKMEDKMDELDKEGKSPDAIEAYMLSHRNDFHRSTRLSIEDSAAELVKHGLCTEDEARKALQSIEKAKGKMTSDNEPKKSSW